MAKAAEETENGPDSASADLPKCGVVMPISATTNHSEAHWADVQKLLHRAIRAADFEPANVWEGSATDRISERIIANLFEYPLAVVDISDLNPNVMLELGMRLSSRKPTIVVAKRGATIPFDIRDFQAVLYPADLNMLGMEDFFTELGKMLVAKYQASLAEGYTPFLGNIVVDVLSPAKRELPIDELVLSRLDDLSRRLGGLETKVVTARSGRSAPDRPSAQYPSVVSSQSAGKVSLYFTIPTEFAGVVVEEAQSVRGVTDAAVMGEDEAEDASYIVVYTSKSAGATRNALIELVERWGGRQGVPENFKGRLRF